MAPAGYPLCALILKIRTVCYDKPFHIPVFVRMYSVDYFAYPPLFFFFSLPITLHHGAASCFIRSISPRTITARCVIPQFLICTVRGRMHRNAIRRHLSLCHFKCRHDDAVFQNLFRPWNYIRLIDMLLIRRRYHDTGYPVLTEWMLTTCTNRVPCHTQKKNELKNE